MANPLDTIAAFVGKFFWVIQIAMWIALIGLVYFSGQDAAFYCQKYCEATGNKFTMYSPGTCRCTHAGFEPNISAFINISVNTSEA